jgi:hypothetical protein
MQCEPCSNGMIPSCYDLNIPRRYTMTLLKNTVILCVAESKDLQFRDAPTCWLAMLRSGVNLPLLHVNHGIPIGMRGIFDDLSALHHKRDVFHHRNIA